MPDIIEYYAKHEDERKQIAENMSNLIHNELTLENSIEKIINKAKLIFAERNI